MRLGIWILGQSNVVRQLIGYPAGYEDPLPAILAQRTASSKAAFEASGWDVDQISDLRPRIVGGSGRCGVEQSLARAIAAWMLPANIVIIRTAISGCDFNTEWDPTGVWPTIDNNAFTQARAYVRSVLATYGARLGIFVHVAGEGDANAASNGPSQAYHGNMVQLHDDFLRAEFGNVIYLYNRLYRGSLWNPTRRDLVRSAQEAFHDPGQLRFMVDMDDQETADGQHYTIDALITMGTRMGAGLDAIRRAWPRKFGAWAYNF